MKQEDQDLVRAIVRDIVWQEIARALDLNPSPTAQLPKEPEPEPEPTTQ